MIDKYGRKIDYLRISLTDRCNYRCEYCMPEEGIEQFSHEDMLTLEEVYKLAEIFVEMGVKKIRLTGGEPGVRKGYMDLIKELGKLDIELTMTTNGSFLEETAEDLKAFGLDRVNISLDTLDPIKYKKITRKGDLEKVIRGIEKAYEIGLRPIKINAVLMKDFTEEEIVPLTDLSRDRDIHIRFIELMPIGSGKDKEDLYLPGDFVVEKLKDLKPLDRDGVARRYKFEGAKGTVGIITPISDHFCYKCNRVRLQSNGQMLLCLHSNKGFDLKEPLRSGVDMKKLIGEYLQYKPRGHNLKGGEGSDDMMSAIGG